MMLRKEVCRKCIDKHSDRKWNKQGIDDDRYWVEGHVCCPRKFSDFPAYNISVPKRCPYILEHVIR